MTKKRVRLIRWVALAATLPLITAACGGDDDKKNVASSTKATAAPSGPAISITSPASGATLKGNTVTLPLKIDGLTVVKADGDSSGKTGHIHAFIDRAPVAPGALIAKEPGIVHSVDNPLVLTGLSKGSHEITVVLGDGSHNRIGDAKDTITVTVDGPTVDATAPATVAAGKPVRIDFKVDGVQLVKADGDASGKTGHVHVFVDQPMPKAGEPIGKAADNSVIHTAESFVEIPNLAPGEHVFFVVLGDGAHVPLAPLVADRVVVTVQ